MHNGSEASDTFRRMAAMSPEEQETYRGHLLKDCGLDTFAMVKAWERLRKAGKEGQDNSRCFNKVNM